MRQHGMPVEEREFSIDELRGAREIFLTSATSFVKPITRLDNEMIGGGTPGPVATRLFAMMAGHVTAQPVGVNTSACA
jgi:D-alanine transaminase